jgi:hypothetical protein
MIMFRTEYTLIPVYPNKAERGNDEKDYES